MWHCGYILLTEQLFSARRNVGWQEMCLYAVDKAIDSQCAAK
jgi:hypothetical protein